MKRILIAGGSGFIGKYLTSKFKEEGYRVSILTRKGNNNSAKTYFRWDPGKGIINEESLKDQDIIINLTGAGIADRLWTGNRKKVIRDSRIKSTQLLVKTLKKYSIIPELFINVSAIGYYGDRPDKILTEKSPAGSGFLSQVCQEWENALKPLSELAIPYTIIRLGILLGKEGGSLPKLLLPLRFRINLIYGRGKQNISWIHMADIFQIMFQLAEKKLMPRVYNGVAPEALSQSEFNRTIIKILHWHVLTVRIPSRLLFFLAGELATVILDHQHVKPAALLDQQFQFRFPRLKEALTDLLNK